MSAIKAVVAAVTVHQRLEGAKKRRTFPTRYGVTFFTVHDVWLYQTVMDAKVCPICKRHEDTGEFHGNHLRATFPYLEIIDENTIKAHAHMPRDDNCRCYLTRLIEEPELKPKEPFYWFNSQGGDFTPEERILYVEQIKVIINELPKQHTDGIDEVVVVGEFPGSPNTAGRYTRSPTLTPDEIEERIQIKITSLRSEPKWDERIITYHEVGHHVWFTKTDKGTRDSWVQFWANNPTEMPTAYAKKNPAEGFAESYAYTQFNPFGVNPGVRKWFSEHKDVYGK